MQSAKRYVEIGGEQHLLLFTPSVMLEAKRRNIQIKMDTDNPEAIFETVTTLIWLSAHSARAAQLHDNPELGPLQLEYCDVLAWAWQHQDEVADISRQMIAGIFGSSGKGSKEVKKKR